MKPVLREEISSIKKLMNITEEKISVSKGGYTNISTDNDATSTDVINKALLDDIEAAAKSAGLKATITTASSGHPDEGTSKSRHSQQNAVDIAIINGVGSGGATNEKNGNSQFREFGNKLVSVLEKMGYVRNSEGTNSKSVFWQTNTGGNHFNHVHVSNTSETPSSTKGVNTTTSGSTNPIFDRIFGVDSPPQENIGSAISTIQNINQKLGITESETFSNKKKISKGGENVFSYVSGEVVNRDLEDCEDYVTIYFVNNMKGYYLTYCGLETIKVREGQQVQKNTVLGYSDDSVYVYFNDSQGNPLPYSYFQNMLQIKRKGDEVGGKKKKKKEPESALGKVWDRAMKKDIAAATIDLAGHFLNPFSSRYNDKGEEVYPGITLNPLKKDFWKQSVTNNAPEWSKEKNYEEGDLVKFDGDTYESQTKVMSGGKNPKESSDWELKQIQGTLTQLYKYDRKGPNDLKEEIERIKDLLK